MRKELQKNADDAAKKANDAATAASAWSNVTASVTMLDPSASPSVKVSDIEGGKKMDFELPRGQTGATPDIQIGKVNTVAAGSPAKVTKSGTAENPVFDFDIPQGEAGSVMSWNGIAPDEAGDVKVEIGGRNLIPNTRNHFEADGTNSNNAYARLPDFTIAPLPEGVYTFSAKVDFIEGNAESCEIRYRDADRENVVAQTIPIVDGTIRKTLNVTSARADRIVFAYIYAGVGAATMGNKVRYSDVKLERGSVPTDWTPAPEDKQDKLSGTAGQIVGFDEDGNAVAQNFADGSNTLVTEIIPNGADLDDYISDDLRIYRANSNAGVSNILNKPDGMNGSFALLCGRTSNGASYFQILIPYNKSNGLMYLRKDTSGTWSEWFEFAKVADITNIELASVELYETLLQKDDEITALELTAVEQYERGLDLEKQLATKDDLTDIELAIVELYESKN